MQYEELEKSDILIIKSVWVDEK